MKRLSIAVFILVLLLCASCQNQTKPKTDVIDEVKFELEKYKDKFKFEHLDSFYSDSFEFDERPIHYKSIDSLAFLEICQDSFFYQKDSYFYYSIQKAPKGQTWITLIENSFDVNGDIIWLLIYDNRGKLKRKLSLASCCGDAGWSYNSSSKWINSNSYCNFSEECQVDNEDSIEYSDCDKIQTQIEILEEGKISSKTIFKKHLLDTLIYP